MINTLISENIRLACQIIPEGNINFKIEIIDTKKDIDSSFKIQDSFTNFRLNYPFQPNIPYNKTDPLLGAVVDIGTTSIALTIINLNNGLILGADSILNPQIDLGRDIMTRLTFALKSSLNQKQLQEKVFWGISTLLKRVTSSISVSTKDIAEMVVVGNTVMHHLFLNLPVDKLARAPFVPTLSEEFTTEIQDVDPEGILNLPLQTIVTMPPLIGSFIGSDAIADILYIGLDKSDGVHLLIDFGTNSEIIIVNEGNLYAASVAAGGAFEGQHINCGMRGVEGAIESFWIENGEYKFEIINSTQPKGICGSGIVDILSELLIHGQLDHRGRLFSQSKEQINNLTLIPANKIYSNYPIYLTRADVESIQKAKAATMAAIRTLTKYLDIEINQIEAIHIAGVFGSKLNIKSAKIIGLLPNLPEDKFIIHGNTAEKGGRTILLSMQARKAVQNIARQVERCELTNFPKFQSYFTEELFFPENIRIL